MKKTLMNTIFVERATKVIVEKGQHELPKVYLATAIKNLEDLGYTFSTPLIERVSTLSKEEFVEFYQTLVKDLKKMLGAHVVHQPMYPNFPTQVMEASEAELFINAIVHGISTILKDVAGVELENRGLPQYEKEEHFPLLSDKKLKEIELGTEEEFYTLIRNLIGAKTSISESDKADVDKVIGELDDVSLVMPSTITMKENMAFTVASLMKHEKISVNLVSTFTKTATDVLRLIVALSDGDVSLSDTVRFRKFKRWERRLLLGLLEKSSNPTEDMLRYAGLWIAVGTVLHPGEYKSRYPKAFAAFDVLRENKAFETFNNKLEKALKEGNVEGAIYLLMGRPGEFARRLDHVLRISDHPSEVLSRFNKVAGEVATPLLLQVAAHFKNRNSGNELRTFFPKGNVARVVAIENALPPLSEEICNWAVKACNQALSKRFAELPKLGKVALDESLKEYIVPFSQRSASKTLNTVSRGSKLPLSEDEWIRMFLYWKEGNVNGERTGSVDIDASFVFYGEDWNYLELISFHHMRSEAYQAVHSGDIRSAPNGASEFIDVNVPAAISNGARYVVMSINSYSHHPFSDLPECFAGWMGREDGTTGEIFEPKTVENKVDLAADTQIAIPVIFDLVERKAIWCDLAMTHTPEFYNTAAANQEGMALMGRALTTLVKPNLYDLFLLHALERGELVEDKEEADVVFSVNEGITPYNIETIIAEYLV